MTGQEIADVIFLALAEYRASERTVVEVPAEELLLEPDAEETTVLADILPEPSPASEKEFIPPEPQAEIFPAPVDTSSLALPDNYKPIPIPNPPAIAHGLQIARTLRPLARQVNVGIAKTLHETATVEFIAETGIWHPILKPDTELWLDVALVLDTSPSMALWQRFSQDLTQIFSRYGEFRDLRIWKLRYETHQPVNLTSLDGTVYSPRALLSAEGRRVVVVVSDCVASAWHDGRMRDLMGIWAEKLPTVVVQVFPERLWSRTALARSIAVELQGKPFHGADNTLHASHSLKFYTRSYWDQKRLNADSQAIDTQFRLPILTIEIDSLADWVKVVLGDRNARVAGILWLDAIDPDPKASESHPAATKPTPDDWVDSFLLTASPIARELGALLAFAPVITLPIVRLIQRSLLPHSTSVHVAEVWMSGLLKVSSPETPTFENAEKLAYQLIDEGVRDRLRAGLPAIYGLIVLEKVSAYVAKSLGKSIQEFKALLKLPPSQHSPQPDTAFLNAFAKVTASILRGLGSQFNEIADSFAPLEQETETLAIDEWPLEDLAYDVAEFVNVPTLEDFDYKPAKITDILERFEFETAKVEWITTKRFGNLGFGRPKRQLKINRSRSSNLGYIEPLNDEIGLEMAYIPSGTFIMGAPESEPESMNREQPQHEVTVDAFYLGRYPITQAQWRLVAALPQINCALDPKPSSFTGDNRPIEGVSWDDATEFCQRLSALTGKTYRLPSEAEWEYACRAGTTTPFYFGETITTEVANYYGNYTYNDSPKGEVRGQTTDVGSFPANAYGLHDMHGNVWEWCLDHWHENYQEAPNDGSALMDEEANTYVLRGGSWSFDPRHCRSAFRSLNTRDFRDFIVGFRVCCVLPRTQIP